ncbi:MAG TPA: nucleotide sugar dehydrogenase [Planctomycetota bacterium]|nr:nucleotide sugar dehydrogenase [Planctomycetota bacterium]
MKERTRKADICVVGGAGHVGLPLALAFAHKGQRVIAYDINKEALEVIGKGKMPFIEYGAEPILKEVLNKTLFLSSDIHDISTARFVVITVGTPVDEFLNPKLRALLDFINKLYSHLDPEQTIIIRSTVYPRTCRQLKHVLDSKSGGDWNIAYCPERIAQGYAIEELGKLPQIVSGLTEKAVADVTKLFSLIAPSVIRLDIEEAELAKLFSNAWRYIQFATANQFYMISEQLGSDFNKVRRAMVEGYGRAASLPGPGFAAGPCLLKDTMQLAAFNSNSFMLGHSAMMVNEGLPGFLVEQLEKRHDLKTKKVGILGMAFKADIDDTRDSLSYKLGKILRFHGATVLYSDEFAKDPTFISKEDLVSKSDIVIVGVPHSAYKTLSVPQNVDVVDVWNVLPKGPKK